MPDFRDDPVCRPLASPARLPDRVRPDARAAVRGEGSPLLSSNGLQQFGIDPRGRSRRGVGGWRQDVARVDPGEEVIHVVPHEQVLPQGHGTVLGHHDRGVATDLTEPVPELLSIAHRRRQGHHLHRFGEQDDDLLPHGTPPTVGEVMHLVHDDEAEPVQGGGPGIQHVAEHLGGHDDHGGLAMDGGVSGEQPDVGGAVHGDEVVILLV